MPMTLLGGQSDAYVPLLPESAGSALYSFATTTMPGFLRSLYLCYFAQPKSDRTLYKLLKKQPVRKFLELGLGTAERTLRVLEHCPANDETSYTGIDLFEMRQNGDGAGLTLKEAHKLLSLTGVKVRLVPGDPMGALSRSANAIGKQDLIVISADQDRDSLKKAWFYVPRLLTETTQVLLEERLEGVTNFRTVPHDEIATLAQPPGKSRRAA